jgi:tripartite-type tricarboxylate transporter receptor subunit TctC
MVRTLKRKELDVDFQKGERCRPHRTTNRVKNSVVSLLAARVLLTLIPIVSASQFAASQEFPLHSITVVVPFPPGGGLDFLARTIQPKMEAALGQPLVIENKPGDLGNIGNAYVATAPRDGYTALMTAVNIGVFPHIFSNLPYDPLRAFAPIGEVAQTPGGCIVGPNSRFKDFGDIINEAKAKPASIKFASEGTGSPSHLIVQLIAQLNGVHFTRVPYDFASLSIAAVMDGSVDFSCNGLVGNLPLIREGKVRALAVTSAKRSVALPDVPTVNETGFGYIDENSRYVLVAPAGTPGAVMTRLSASLATVLADQTIQETLISKGFDLASAAPSEVSGLIQRQYEQWGPFIRDAGLK